MSERKTPATSVLSVIFILAIRLPHLDAADFREDPSELNSVVHEPSLNVIFGDDILQENIGDVHRRASAMSAVERYEFLVDWVLPGDRHQTFRVNGEFSGTNAPPIRSAAANELDSRKTNGSSEAANTAATNLTPGVVVISPALYLIETAVQTGRLDDLRDRVVATQIAEADAQQNYARVALLFLIEVARDDSAAATLAFDDVMAHAAKIDRETLQARWPALLMLRAAISNPNKDIRRLVTEFFFSIYIDLKFYAHDSQFDVINDHLRTLFSLNRFLGENGTVESQPPHVSGQWLGFVYSDSETRGHGRPPASWHTEKGKVLKLSGHEMEFLSFRSPLRGNFQVECDFSARHGEQVSFMIAGSHVQAVSWGNSLRTGNFRKNHSDAEFETPLTGFDEFARYRAVVKDGVLTHYLNGNAVLERKLAEEHDPWIAIRTWRRALGRVHDFRITGDPVIPDQIDLTGDPELSGWAPYFEAGFGPGAGNWQAVSIEPEKDQPANGESEKTGILGRRHPDHPGAAVQKLLRYCRPVAEDGTIEYEFYYREGEACVHPALDRLAFMLDPAGVRIHWITDRRYERSSLDPDNRFDEPENRRGPLRIPLIEDAWNRLKLEVEGDAVQLSLNGQVIYERTLEDSNQRTFGLFHFADRTAARVRNVVWRGDWPKQFPSLSDQDLAATDLDFLEDQLPQLADSFDHDFRDGPLRERFDIVGDEAAVEQQENGVRTSLVGGDGLKEFRSCLRVYGDFDITVAFEDLEIQMPIPRWEAGIGVRMVLDSETDDVCGLYRTLARNNKNRKLAFFHSSRKPDGRILPLGGYVVEESTSGRFRVARRGAMLYGLFAADDSPNFRLVGQREATADPVAVQGLRLVMKGEKSVAIGTTWKEMHVRAEKISGLPLPEPGTIIAKLNARRNALAFHEFEFVDVETMESHFRPSVSRSTVFTPEDAGLRVTTAGGDRSVSCVLANRIPFQRGTDVEFTMDIHKLGMSDTQETKCEIALKVFFESSIRNSRNPREATFILRQKAGGVRDLVTRIVHHNSARQLVYLPLHTTPVESPDSYRLAVHENTMYFMYSEADSDEYHIAATSPVSEDLPAVGINLKFVAHGPGHRNDLTMKKLIVHQLPEAATEQIQPAD